MLAGRNKALLELAGRPLVVHCVETFRVCCERVLIVVRESDMRAVSELLPEAAIVIGGSTRQGSERNGLDSLRGEVAADDVIAFHDAARPLVSASDVRAVFAAAERHGAAMLAAAAELPALSIAEARVVRAYPAAAVWRAQTPQAARAEWLLVAYDRATQEGFDGTDTAAVLERSGYAVRVVGATSENPKVTVPADLRMAEALLSDRSLPKPR